MGVLPIKSEEDAVIKDEDGSQVMSDPETNPNTNAITLWITTPDVVDNIYRMAFGG